MRDELEANWLANGAHVEPAGAFAEAERRLAAWTERVAEAARSAPRADVRPAFVQSDWQTRNERAGLQLP